MLMMIDLSQLWDRLDPLRNPINLLDILLVTMLFWWLLDVIRGTRAVQLLRGVTVLLVVSLAIGTVLPLQTLGWLLENAVRPALFVGIPVLFQPELRRALETLGRTGDLLARRPFTTPNGDMSATITLLARAAAQLSQRQTGALIVIERNTGLQEYADRGVLVDARLSVALLLNIFFPNAPLHDMAVICPSRARFAPGACVPL